MSTVTTCTYNAGNASRDKVAADFKALIALFAIVCLQEVADRARELAATGARVLQLDGNDRGHVAIAAQQPGDPRSGDHVAGEFVVERGQAQRTIAQRHG